MGCAACVLVEVGARMTERERTLAALVFGVKLGRSSAWSIELCPACNREWLRFVEAANETPGTQTAGEDPSAANVVVRG